MDYQASLGFIKECARYGWKLDLDRITEIMERLDHPERRFRSVHLAGTNGKGSTAAMLDSVLRAAKLRVGKYTSPHLGCYRERITLNGELIPKEELAELVTEMKPVIESVTGDGFGTPTEFEVGTALAFLFFARKEAEIAVVEVGMGGRFDATNVINPILSVITHLALDHQQFLGDTLEQIALEKAGVIKRKVPVVIGVQEPGVAELLGKIAASRKAPVRFAGDLKIKNVKLMTDGSTFQLENTCFGELHLKLGLIGKHQIFNSLNVVAAVEDLVNSGIRITIDDLQAGLAGALWPGRLEPVHHQAGPLKLYLDGAHNPDGVRTLVDTLKTLYPGEKVDFLIGILNNRPLKEMARIFAEVAGKVIVTRVPEPNSASSSELAGIFQELGITAIDEPLPERALRLLLATGNPVAVASGSLYLIGLLRSLLLGTGD